MANEINRFLEIALKKGASDLHFSVGRPPVIRVSRDLVDMEGEPVFDRTQIEELAKSLIDEDQWAKFLKNRDIDFGYQIGSSCRFRVNFYFERGNISMAFRVISQKIRTIEELGLPEIMHSITEASQGLVLVTGASSQGKSTTLAALIDEINRKNNLHIITIEDPIEYVFQDNKCLINQREIGRDTESFAGALRAALREDPDVIMVGEMRDLDTISIALTAAETGHLVFATLHTNSASQTIHRIIDIFPPYQQSQIRAQLSSSLLAVVSQRLVVGQKKGMIPACEIMFNNSAVANLIRESKIHEIPTVIETSGAAGMISLNKYLAELVKNKKISKETAIKNSINPDDLISRLGRT